MACGLLTPTAGSVTISGVDVHQDPELAQSYIGYLSDFFSVYDGLKVDYFGRALLQSAVSVYLLIAIRQRLTPSIASVTAVASSGS